MSSESVPNITAERRKRNEPLIEGLLGEIDDLLEDAQGFDEEAVAHEAAADEYEKKGFPTLARKERKEARMNRAWAREKRRQASALQRKVRRMR